jgi:branched-chain amino acid transport system substrate-binding protein
MSKKKWLSMLVVFTLILALSVTGCGNNSATPPVTTNDFVGTIKVGVIQPQTGAIAFGGQAAVNGHILATEDINEAGGIVVDGKRYKLELVIEDDAATPKNAAAAASKLIARDGVLAILGTFTSSCSLAIAEVTNREQITQMSPLSSAASLTTSGFEFFFRGRVTTAFNAPIAAMHFANQGVQKISLLAINDDWGRGDVSIFSALWKELGLEVIEATHFEQGQTDFYSELTRLANGKPDAIFVTASTEAASMIFRQAKEIAPDIKIFTSGGIDPTEVFRLAGGDVLDGLMFWSVDAPMTDTLKELKDRYEAKFSVNIMSNSYSAYDATMVLKDAIERANTTTDSVLVRDAMRKTAYDGYMGHYNYDGRGESFLTMSFGVFNKTGFEIEAGSDVAKTLDKEKALGLYKVVGTITGLKFPTVSF